jgi:peptidoglycan/LPS O-acetylase OafA/YrhL
MFWQTAIGAPAAALVDETGRVTKRVPFPRKSGVVPRGPVVVFEEKENTWHDNIFRDNSKRLYDAAFTVRRREPLRGGFGPWDDEANLPRHLHLSEIEMPAQSGHIPSLDGLRACSILIVLLSHFVNATLFPGGLGVYVFFIISGFLITRLLIGEHKQYGRISLGNFYLRRGLRLYPVVLAFTATVPLVMLVRGLPVNIEEPLSALFYFANYLYADDQPRSMPFTIFWSLSIEEHFYFLLPTVMLLLRANPKRLLGGMLLVCLGALALRLRAAADHPELLGTYYFYFRTEFRIDSLAFGVALACLCEIDWGRRLILRLAHPSIFAAAMLAIVGCLLYRNDYFRETLRYTLLGCGITVAICYVLFRPTMLARWLNSGFFVGVGLLSYSLYLWHFIAPQVLTFFLPGLQGALSVLALFAVSFAMAAASYHLLEQPFMRLRGRLRANAAAGRGNGSRRTNVDGRGETPSGAAATCAPASAGMP